MTEIVAGIPNVVTIVLCVVAFCAGRFVIGAVTNVLEAAWEWLCSWR